MMTDNSFARVAVLTAVIGIHITSVIRLSAADLPPPSSSPDVDEDVSAQEEHFDAAALSKQFFRDIQEQSELFQSLFELVTYNPAEENIDPDLNHCMSVKRAVGIDILTDSIDLFLRQCISPVRKLGGAVDSRVKEFLEAIKSLDHLAYEDALACVQLGDKVNFEPIIKCLDNVLTYRELSFFDYLEETRQNYLTINRQMKSLSECGIDVLTIIENQIESLLNDVYKCTFRIEHIETFFAETYDESDEWSENRGKAVVKEIVTFSIAMIMDRINELKKQLSIKFYHTEITNMASDTERIISNHKEKLDSIAKAAMLKVQDTELMGERFNQCTSTIAEETNIRVKLAFAAIIECVDEAVRIEKYFTSGIASYGEEIQMAFEKQKELILTCTGKLIADMSSPSAEEVKQTVNCIKFNLLFNSDKFLVDLEEKVQTFLTSTWAKMEHFTNNLETVNICTSAALFNFKEIMDDNAEFIDLCVEEASGQYLEKDEL